MTTTDKPGDPADKAADGAFGGIQSHRSGYGDDKLERVIGWLRKRPDMTLASGEGALLLAEIDRLRDDLHTQEPWVEWANREMDALRRANKDSADHYADARAEIDRLRGDLQKQIDTVHYLIGERTADREHWGQIETRADRAERILAALREPSEAIVDAAAHTFSDWDLGATLPEEAQAIKDGIKLSISAAVAAAEREVGG